MAHFRSRSSSAGGSFVQNHHNDLPSLTTPDEMRGTTPERKSSKISGGGGSFWSRKSLKRSNTTNSTSPPVQPPPQTPYTDALCSPQLAVGEEALLSPFGSIAKLSHSRSLNPESMNGTPMPSDPFPDLPQPVGFKVKYHLHNPLGPRWYKNYHLIPPAEKQPSARPPTFFSTSFPPISTSSTPDNIHETGTVSKRASVSPQATPASSQIRIGDGIKPRSRKTSQTAPDNVDLMDVTDPWGSTWHHDSPYDILAPVSTKLELDGARPRRASMTAAQNSFKAVAPSPLSQSTSAVHLHDLVPEKPPSTVNSINIAGPRKLSKRRNPNNADLATLFRPPPKESEHRKTASAPPTPIERVYLSEPITPDSLPKRMSVAPPVFSSQPQVPPKREKRTSFVGRIAKKFNLFRRSEDFLADNSREYSWLHVNAEDHASMKRPSFDHIPSHPPSEKVGPPKRVAPPPIAQEPPQLPPPEKDEPPQLPPPSPPFSYVSLEAPFSIGKLTVANPDFDPDTGSPIQKPPQLQRDFSVTNSLSPPPSIPREPSPPPGMLTIQNPTLERTSSHYDKPLPVPVPSTAGSTLGLSTPTGATERGLEQEGGDPTSLSDSRRATVLSATSQQTAIPAAPQIPQARATLVDSDSDSDTDSSDSDSSSDTDEEKETSDVSNRPVPPDSTVNAGASTVSAAPTLPAKDKVPAVPTPTPTPPPAPTLANPTRSKSPETPSPSRVKSQASVINDRISKVLPEAVTLRPPIASMISGVTAGVFLPVSPEEVTSQDRINSFLSYTDSPYSATSVLANPPTPFHSAVPIDLEAPPLPAKEGKERESRVLSPRNTPVSQPVGRTEASQDSSSDSKQAVVAGQQGHIDGEDARAVSKARSSKDEHKRRESRARRESSQPTSSPSSSRQHTQDEQAHRGSVRHSKVPHQGDVSSIPMPKMPSASNVRHSSVYNRYLDDAPPVRQYEETPPPPPPRDDSSSKRRLELRKEREREKEEKARAEEKRRKEERRRQEEKRQEEERERERERERRRESERRENERAWRRREREEQRERELERERELDRERELRRQHRALEREREKLERERQEWERMEKERERERQQRELELQLHIQRKFEMEERERERQKLKEMEEEREREKKRVRELEREREREKERVRELEREKERLSQLEKEREKERERERLKQLEKERDKERQRALELEREKERLSELERERARELERERERLRQLELEREREKFRKMEEEKEKERKRKEREGRRKAEKNKRASQHHADEQRSSDDSRSRRKRESRRSEDERKDKSKSVYHTPDQSRTESYYANATQSIYLAADPNSRVERKPSTATTRPTSELPSAADMNALRAKEAWDMDRMWKARSMYGAELNGNAVQSIPTQSVLSFSDNLSSQGASYGSSYTAFAVQAPFQGPSMPFKVPHMMYGSPASIPSLPDSALYDPYDQNNIGNTTAPPPPPRQRRISHHALSAPDGLPVLSRSPLSKNPLPEPPRESTYQPAPLPPIKPATTTVRTSDYWTKYAGVTTNA